MPKAFYACTLGLLEVGYEGMCVTSLSLVAEPSEADRPNAFSAYVIARVREFLDGKRRGFDFAISPKGTPFQKRVWQALLEIPYGQTATYSEIAARIGSPKSARAVGSACHNNPILLAIPCHRVVGKGFLGGFACGLAVKESLLSLEKNYIARQYTMN